MDLTLLDIERQKEQEYQDKLAQEEPMPIWAVAVEVKSTGDVMIEFVYAEDSREAGEIIQRDLTSTWGETVVLAVEECP